MFAELTDRFAFALYEVEHGGAPGHGQDARIAGNSHAIYSKGKTCGNQRSVYSKDIPLENIAMRTYDTLDEALDRLKIFAPDLRNGFTNHAPMAIEALCALGRGDTALPWLEKNWGYRVLLLPRPAPRHPIVDWKTALGNGCSEDWSDFLAPGFTVDRWRNSAPLWIERLLPGIAAAALHGVIRTGHAVRSLGDAVTPQRLAELRDATAYWAAHYQTLPTEQDGAPPLPAREAVLRLSRIPTERQKRCGAITSALDVLADEPAFAAAIDLLDVSGDPTVVLSDLTETFSRVFLANAVDQMGLITFIHGVTGVVALRSLLPLLPAGAVREALRRLWQIDAALYVALGVAPPLSGEIVAPKEGRETLIDRAVATNDEHAIKFTEAALREYDIRPNPVYLAAIARAIAALS